MNGAKVARTTCMFLATLTTGQTLLAIQFVQQDAHNEIIPVVRHA